MSDSNERYEEAKAAAALLFDGLTFLLHPPAPEPRSGAASALQERRERAQENFAEGVARLIALL